MPEMLGAGRAVVRRSTVTVEVHDIGQNPLYSMPEGRGFPVIDLAVQVSPEKVVAGILEHEPDIVGFSAFIPMFKADINVLQKGGPARPGDRSWSAAPPPHRGERRCGRRRRRRGRRRGRMEGVP